MHIANSEIYSNKSKRNNFFFYIYKGTYNLLVFGPIHIDGEQNYIKKKNMKK